MDQVLVQWPVCRRLQDLHQGELHRVGGAWRLEQHARVLLQRQRLGRYMDIHKKVGDWIASLRWHRWLVDEWICRLKLVISEGLMTCRLLS